MNCTFQLKREKTDHVTVSLWNKWHKASSFVLYILVSSTTLSDDNIVPITKLLTIYKSLCQNNSTLFWHAILLHNQNQASLNHPSFFTPKILTTQLFKYATSKIQNLATKWKHKQNDLMKIWLKQKGTGLFVHSLSFVFWQICCCFFVKLFFFFLSRKILMCKNTRQTTRVCFEHILTNTKVMYDAACSKCFCPSLKHCYDSWFVAIFFFFN